MPNTKSKWPVTPVPLAPALRRQLYALAEQKGRKFTKHLQIVLQEYADRETAK